MNIDIKKRQILCTQILRDEYAQRTGDTNLTHVPWPEIRDTVNDMVQKSVARALSEQDLADRWFGEDHNSLLF